MAITEDEGQKDVHSRERLASGNVGEEKEASRCCKFPPFRLIEVVRLD